MASYQFASLSNNLKIWNIETGKSPTLFQEISTPPHLDRISWNHTNQVIALNVTQSHIDLLQVSNSQILSMALTDPLPGNLPFRNINFSSNSRYLTFSSRRSLFLCDIKKKQLKFQSTQRGDITSISFLPDGELVAGDSSGALKIWDIKSNRSSEEMIYRENIPVTCLQVSTGTSTISPKIAAGYVDGSLCVFDPSNCTRLRHQLTHKQQLTSLAFSPKNPRLISTCGMDGLITLIDSNSKNVSVPTACIECRLNLSSDGSGSGSGKQNPHNPKEQLTSLSFHEDAIHCAVGTMSGCVLLYDWRNVKKPVWEIDTNNNHTTPGSIRIPVSFLSFQNPTRSTPPPTYSYSTPSKSSSSSSLSSSSLSSTSFSSNSSSASASSASSSSSLPFPSSVVKQLDFSDPSLSVPSSSSSSTTSTSSSSSQSIKSRLKEEEQKQQQKLQSQSHSRQQQQEHHPQLPPPHPSQSQWTTQEQEQEQEQQHSQLSDEKETKEQDQNDSNHFNRKEEETKISPPSSSFSTSQPVQSIHPESIHPVQSIQILPTHSSHPPPQSLSSIQSSTHLPPPPPPPSPSPSPHQHPPDHPQLPEHQHPPPLDTSPHNNIPSSSSFPSHLLPSHQQSYQNNQHPSPPPNPHPNPTPHPNPHSHPHPPLSSSSSSSSYFQSTCCLCSCHSNHHPHPPPPPPPPSPSFPSDYLRKEYLDEALDLIRYDLHRENQTLLREQARQFEMAKIETTNLIQDMESQLQLLLNANRELREENERLRRIY